MHDMLLSMTDVKKEAYASFFHGQPMHRIMHMNYAEAWSIDGMLHLFWLICDWRVEWLRLGVTHI